MFPLQSMHFERLSKDGDPLEVLDATVDFEYFRSWLVEGIISNSAEATYDTVIKSPFFSC